MGSYATKYKTRKWTFVALSYVLDITHVNSQAIYVTNNAKEDEDRFEFGLELMEAFVKPNMHTQIVRGVCQNISITQWHISFERTK